MLVAAAHASIIGRNGADGLPFAIGAGATEVASRAGRLFIGVNDAEPCNNGGSFTVWCGRHPAM